MSELGNAMLGALAKGYQVRLAPVVYGGTNPAIEIHVWEGEGSDRLTSAMAFDREMLDQSKDQESTILFYLREAITRLEAHRGT